MKNARQSSVIATHVNWLSNRLVATASATYGQLGLGFLNARIVMALGRRSGINAARLSEVLGVDPAAVSRALREMKGQKLVDEARAPVRALTLTAEGVRLHRQVEKISDAREARVLRGFSEAEAGRMLDYLERMLSHMDEVAAVAQEPAERTPGVSAGE